MKIEMAEERLSAMESEISDEEMTAIQDAIMKRYGIDFYNYEPKSFKRRLMRIYRKFGFSSSFDLWSRALKDPDFIHDFTNEVSVGLTAFFRDPAFWKFVKTEFGETWKNKREISVWHAGCSSGEEIFTAAVVWNDLGLSRKVRSIATDISSEALKSAASGCFSQLKASEYKRNLKEYNGDLKFNDFFEETTDQCCLKKEYLKNVSFKNSNLIMDDYAAESHDLIFCRNVMIYFDGHAKKKILNKLHQALKKDGLLVFGFLDSMLSHIDETKFEYLSLENRIFRKL